MDVKVVVEAPAPDDRGTCLLSEAIDIPEEFVWKAMLNKVFHFYEYFRVSEFKREELPDGWIYRKMVVHDEKRLLGWGPHAFIERIKADKETGVVEFVDLDHDTEEPTGKSRVNILHRNPLRIEYASVSAEGVKTPLGKAYTMKQQIQEAYDAWQESLKEDGPSVSEQGAPKDSTPASDGPPSKRARVEAPAAAAKHVEHAENGNGAPSAKGDNNA